MIADPGARHGVPSMLLGCGAGGKTYGSPGEMAAIVRLGLPRVGVMLRLGLAFVLVSYVRRGGVAHSDL